MKFESNFLANIFLQRVTFLTCRLQNDGRVVPAPCSVLTNGSWECFKIDEERSYFELLWDFVHSMRILSFLPHMQRICICTFLHPQQITEPSINWKQKFVKPVALRYFTWTHLIFCCSFSVGTLRRGSPSAGANKCRADYINPGYGFITGGYLVKR